MHRDVCANAKCAVGLSFSASLEDKDHCKDNCSVGGCVPCIGIGGSRSRLTLGSNAKPQPSCFALSKLPCVVNEKQCKVSSMKKHVFLLRSALAQVFPCAGIVSFTQPELYGAHFTALTTPFFRHSARIEDLHLRVLTLELDQFATLRR